MQQNQKDALWHKPQPLKSPRFLSVALFRIFYPLDEHCLKCGLSSGVKAPSITGDQLTRLAFWFQ